MDGGGNALIHTTTSVRPSVRNTPSSLPPSAFITLLVVYRQREKERVAHGVHMNMHVFNEEMFASYSIPTFVS